MTELHRIELEHEVAFHDVDALNVVWHGHFYKYFELARTVLFRARRLDMPDLIALGYRLVVIETKCKHTYPLRYGDRVRIAAWFKDIDHRLNVGYEITNVTAERRAARGHTILATLDGAGQLLFVTPGAIAERL